MIFLAQILKGVAVVLDSVLVMVMFIVIAHAILSWVNPDPYNPIVRFINGITEPLLRPLRSRLPTLGAMDFSPIVLILVIYFIRVALVQSMLLYAERIARDAVYSLLL